MGIAQPQQLAKEIASELTVLSSRTEGLYDTLAQKFVALIREIDERFGTSQANTQLTLKQEEISSSIDSLSHAFQNYQNFIQRQSVENQEIFNVLKVQSGKLQVQEEKILQIQEDSFQLELISLNALFASSRLGAAGSAFGCITSELKKVSGETQGLTSTISQRNSEIKQLFNQAFDFWKDLEDSENQSIEGLQTNLSDIVASVQEAAQQLFDALNKLHDQARESKVPLTKIIIEIQNQDRIRQSIDHVLLSLKEVIDYQEPQSVKAALDDLAFQEVLPQLSAKVLEEVFHQLSQDHDVFQREMSRAFSSFDKLNDDRSQLLKGAMAEQIVRQISLAESTFQEFQDAFNRRNLKRKKLVQIGESILTELQLLNEALKEFDTLMTKLVAIDFVARIESAKLNNAQSIHETVATMSELIGHVRTDVKNGSSISEGITKEIAHFMHLYLDHLSLHLETNQLHVNEISSLVIRLGTIRDSFEESLSETLALTTSFEKDYRSENANLAKFSQFVNSIQKQRSQLEKLGANIRKEKEGLMKQQGVTQWQLDTNRLKNIVERFTIFNQKEYAAIFGDFLPEKVADSGEVTLF